MAYGRLHRFLLRSVASQGVLSLIEAQRVVDSCSDDSDISIEDLVKEINDEIGAFQQSVKLTVDELSNEEVLVFLFLGCDETAKSQNIFNANELEYFRLLIEEIVTTETRQITGIHAMNIVGKMKVSFTKTDAQKLLNTWCRMHYLDKENDNYALGVKAIHEFESYFRQNMPDTLEECCLCKQIVFRGCNCPACGFAVHTRCLNRYLEKVQKWPCCKADFSQSQLERLNSESSRLIQTENEQSEAYSAVVDEASEEAVTEEDVQMTLELIPEISQRVTRKRKRNCE